MGPKKTQRRNEPEKVNPQELVETTEEFAAGDMANTVCPVCHALSNPDAGIVCNCEAKRLAEIDKANFIAHAKARRNQQMAPKAQKTQQKQVAPESVPEQQEPEQTPMPEQPVVPEPVKPITSAKEALLQLPDSPSEAQIAAWKSEFGPVYIFPFSIKEMYIYRPIRNAEFRNMKTHTAIMQDEDKFNEQIVLKCILWPKLDPVALNLSRAGFIPTMAQIILNESHFLPIEVVSSWVEEL